jgi:hypothetical protein
MPLSGICHPPSKSMGPEPVDAVVDEVVVVVVDEVVVAPPVPPVELVLVPFELVALLLVVPVEVVTPLVVAPPPAPPAPLAVVPGLRVAEQAANTMDPVSESASRRWPFFTMFSASRPAPPTVKRRVGSRAGAPRRGA